MIDSERVWRLCLPVAASCSSVGAQALFSGPVQASPIRLKLLPGYRKRLWLCSAASDSFGDAKSVSKQVAAALNDWTDH